MLPANAQSTTAAKEEGGPILVPVAQACQLIGCGRTTLYALIGRGELVARRLGARTLIETESIRRLAAALPRVGREAA